MRGWGLMTGIEAEGLSLSAVVAFKGGIFAGMALGGALHYWPLALFAVPFAAMAVWALREHKRILDRVHEESADPEPAP